MALYRIPPKDYYIFKNRGSYIYALTPKMFYETIYNLFREGDFSSLFYLINRKRSNKEKIVSEINEYIETLPKSKLNSILYNIVNNYLFIESLFTVFIDDIFNWICDEKIDFSSEKKFKKTIIGILKTYQANLHETNEWISFDRVLLLYILQQPMFKAPDDIPDLYEYYELQYEYQDYNDHDYEEKAQHRAISLEDEEEELLYGSHGDRKLNAEINYLKSLGFYDGYDDDTPSSFDPNEEYYLNQEDKETWYSNSYDEHEDEYEHEYEDDETYKEFYELSVIDDKEQKIIEKYPIKENEYFELKLKNFFIDKYFFSFNLGDNFFEKTLSQEIIIDVMEKVFPLISSNVFNDNKKQKNKLQRLISIFKLSKKIINQHDSINKPIEDFKTVFKKFEQHIISLFLENDINWKDIGDLETIFDIESIEEIIISYFKAKETIESNMISPYRRIKDVRNKLIERFKVYYEVAYGKFHNKLIIYLKSPKYKKLKRVLIEKGKEYLFNTINSNYSLYRNKYYGNEIAKILISHNLEDFTKGTDNCIDDMININLIFSYVENEISSEAYDFIFDFFNIKKQYEGMLRDVELEMVKIDIFNNKDKLSEIDKYIKEIEFAEERQLIEERFDQKINDLRKFYNKKVDYKENWEKFKEHLCIYSEIINKEKKSDDIIKKTLEIIIGDNLEIKKVFSNAYFMANEFIFNEKSILNNNVELTPYVTGYLKGLEQIFTLIIEYFVIHYSKSPRKIGKINQGYGMILEDNWHENVGLTNLKSYIIDKMLPILVEYNNLSNEIIPKLKYMIERWIKDFRNSKFHLDNLFNIDGESGAKSIVYETNSIIYNLITCFIK